jgi:hypothetical protein
VQCVFNVQKHIKSLACINKPAHYQPQTSIIPMPHDRRPPHCSSIGQTAPDDTVCRPDYPVCNYSGSVATCHPALSFLPACAQSHKQRSSPLIQLLTSPIHVPQPWICCVSRCVVVTVGSTAKHNGRQKIPKICAGRKANLIFPGEFMFCAH